MNHQMKDAKAKLAIYNRKYRLENREKLSKNKKAVYQIDKAKLKVKRDILVQCECGTILSQLSLKRHKKSIKCRDNFIDSFFS